MELLSSFHTCSDSPVLHPKESDECLLDKVKSVSSPHSFINSFIKSISSPESHSLSFQKQFSCLYFSEVLSKNNGVSKTERNLIELSEHNRSDWVMVRVVSLGHCLSHIYYFLFHYCFSLNSWCILLQGSSETFNHRSQHEGYALST